MTAALRKAAERRWRKAEGQVALSGWLSASDHAALTQMARDSGMTQAQVVGRLIADARNEELRSAVARDRAYRDGMRAGFQMGENGAYCRYDMIRENLDRDIATGHSDLTAAVGL